MRPSRVGDGFTINTRSYSVRQQRSYGWRNPFSAVPTAYRVHARGRWWYANCAWDAFGICAALHSDGRIETSCPDCGEPLAVTVCDERPDDEGLLFHCLVPAAHWWDDIVFT
jgi:Alkylmercury lyase